MDSKHILVIDDEKNLRMVIQMCLELVRGWRVTLAASGQEGLQKVEVERPDAILLDVMMPAMDGIVFVQKLRENPKLQSIPVVLVTAEAQFIKPMPYKHMGIWGLIDKPFEALKLADQVADILGWD
jgi:CheY-like chemotaxis protein